MTVPAPPLPDIRTLVAACGMKRFSEAPWTGSNSTHRAETYFLGRYALAAAVEALLRRSGASPIALYVPDYICNEALERIRSLPANLHFYAIRENLTPDWEALEKEVVSNARPGALLVVDYFGFPNDSALAVNFCRRHELSLIRDSAHVLRSSDQMMDADFIVFSAHKLLPVGSCAVLVSTPELHDFLPVRRQQPRVRFDTLLWLAKRVTQKLMIASGVPWHRRWSENGQKSPPRPESEETAADLYSESLLSVEIEQAEAIAERRRQNYSALLGRLRDVPGIHPLIPSLAEGYCPYVLPLCAPDIGAEKLSLALLRRGVPALQWPELPPEVLQAPSGHETARLLFERIVLLPVHQSLRPHHIETIARSVKDAVERLRAA
jgi:perosamine synthetase